MTLFEQYETLRRRGMPEHPRLRRRVPPWWTLTDSLELDDPRHVRGGDTIHPDDARDLLEAAARRWWLSFGLLDNGGQGEHELRVQCGSGLVNYAFIEDHPEAMGVDILDAIIAATEHLEPHLEPEETL